MPQQEIDKLQDDFEKNYYVFKLERQDENHCSEKGIRALAEAAKIQDQMARVSSDTLTIYHLRLCDEYKSMVQHFIRYAQKPVQAVDASGEVISKESQDSAAQPTQTASPWLEMMKPTITFDDLVGETDNKQRLLEVIGGDKNKRRIMDIYGYEPGRLFLLYGPTGSGKTALAEAAASHVLDDGGVFYKASCSTLLNKYVGETPRLIKELFDQVRKEKRYCVLLLDEIDALVPKRDSELRPHEVQMITEFLQQLGDFKNEKALIIAATNVPWNIDEAIINRISNMVFIDLPDEETRKSALSLFFSHKLTLAPDLDIDALAKGLEHCSFRDLKKIDKEIRRELVSRHERTNESQVVTNEIVQKVRSQMSIIITDDYLKRYQNWANAHTLDK